MSNGITTSFDQLPIPYCTRCGIADSRVTHVCPPLQVSSSVMSEFGGWANRRDAAQRMSALYDAVSEKDWQQQVRDLLTLNQWQTYHTHDSRRSDAGFPDLIALHPASGDRLVAELKREQGRATTVQLQWLAWFEACGIDAYLWRPSEIDRVIERVSKRR